MSDNFEDENSFVNSSFPLLLVNVVLQPKRTLVNLPGLQINIELGEGFLWSCLCFAFRGKEKYIHTFLLSQLVFFSRL